MILILICSANNVSTIGARRHSRRRSRLARPIRGNNTDFLRKVPAGTVMS